MNPPIHLGYEVGTGKPVAIPARHMVVTGQTQEAGKTTTLEALISRSGLPAIAFVTKRGEQSFASARRIEPYFRERADWQFVASVLEATMRERLKFERAWIMRASKGAKTLADVQDNVRRLMRTAKGLSEDVYMTLDEYLNIVVPRVASVRFAKSLDLAPGLNVLDLSDRETFPPELQSLVMRSVLEWVYEKCDGTITIIPEAWEFIPQGRNSPVKLTAIELIRKGAGLKNYVWLDSQDIGGVEKELLRSCPVWLLGVQREANETKRTLENIPAGIAKPKPSDVQTLERGQFFACWGKHVIKTYVQPEWMPKESAYAVALGEPIPDYRPKPKPQTKMEDTVTASEAKELRAENEELRKTVNRLEGLIRDYRAVKGEPAPTNGSADTEELYESILARLLKEPAIVKLQTRKPEIEVSVKREVITLDDSTGKGRVAKLIAGQYFDEPKKGNAVFKEVTRQGFKIASINIYRALDDLAAMGFLTKEPDGYQAVADMKVNIRRE